MLKRRTWRLNASGAITASKLATAAANALALVVAAHALSPAAFGVFGAVTGGALLLGRLLTLGCEHGYFRLRATTAHSGREPALAGAALAVFAATAAALLVVTLAAAAFVAEGAGTALWAAVGAALGWACAEFAYWIHLARARYLRAVAAQAGTAAGRLLILTLVAAVAPSETALLATWTLCGIGFGGLALLGAAPPIRLPGPALVATLVRYSRWQGLAQALSAVAGQQPVLLLLMVGEQPAEAGKFSLALALMFGVLLGYQGLFEHLTIEVARTGADRLRGFLRAALAKTAVALAAGALLLAAEYLLAPLALPGALWAGGAVFAPLALAALLTVAHCPFEAVLHGLFAPNPIFWSRLIRLALVGALGVPVSILGRAEDMAWLMTLASVVSLAYLVAETERRLRSRAQAGRRAAE